MQSHHIFEVSVLVIIWMAVLGRAKGGGNPVIPWNLDAWLMALPYLLFYPYVGYWVILGYLGAVAGISTGHGRGFNYKEPFKIGSKPEVVEILIPDSLPVYWQKFLIMILTGLAVPLVLSIALLVESYPYSGLILLLSGSFKALAYLVNRTTEAEVLRGLLLGCGIVAALYLLLNSPIT